MPERNNRSTNSHELTRSEPVQDFLCKASQIQLSSESTARLILELGTVQTIRFVVYPSNKRV
jgi:hypothetical protein